jgi:hypothetical protein
VPENQQAAFRTCAKSTSKFAQCTFHRFFPSPTVPLTHHAISSITTEVIKRCSFSYQCYFELNILPTINEGNAVQVKEF